MLPLVRKRLRGFKNKNCLLIDTSKHFFVKKIAKLELSPGLFLIKKKTPHPKSYTFIMFNGISTILCLNFHLRKKNWGIRCR
jgi:hypothetical protein